MASTEDFVIYVCEELHDAGALRYRKMFGEYMVYVNDKPILLICDNTVFVKIVPCIETLMNGAERGLPYQGAKEHYILDFENHALSLAVISEVEKVTAIPVRRPRQRVATVSRTIATPPAHRRNKQTRQ